LLTSQSTSNSNISPIISDFQIEFSALNQYRPVIQYTPSNEYRLIDLYGTTSLSNIQIGVLWKDVFGNFHEFYLNAGGTASIKLLFRRRDFFNATIG
jgi:type 1 glutamine amidotransferase